MNQRNLNRAVASATGETVTAISRMGFSFVEMPSVFAPDPVIDVEDHIVDWDALEAEQRCGLLEAA